MMKTSLVVVKYNTETPSNEYVFVESMLVLSQTYCTHHRFYQVNIISFSRKDLAEVNFVLEIRKMDGSIFRMIKILWCYTHL